LEGRGSESTQHWREVGCLELRDSSYTERLDRCKRNKLHALCDDERTAWCQNRYRCVITQVSTPRRGCGNVPTSPHSIPTERPPDRNRVLADSVSMTSARPRPRRMPPSAWSRQESRPPCARDVTGSLRRTPTKLRHHSLTKLRHHPSEVPAETRNAPEEAPATLRDRRGHSPSRHTVNRCLVLCSCSHRSKWRRSVDFGAAL